MSTAFFVASILGLAFTVNARWPLRRTPLLVGSFFAAWLTTELAPQLLTLHLVVAPVLAVFARASGWRLGLAMFANVATAAGLAAFIAEADAALVVGRDELRDVLGPSAVPQEKARDPMLRWPAIMLMPFRWRHPDVERIRNVSYGPVRRRNALDVFRPRGEVSGAPVLIQVHGGAWVNVSNKDHQGRPLMLSMARRGWVCVAPNYRLSPRAKWPDHIVDVKAAIAWVREHIADYGGDPSFIVVTGGSAGGHLSALAALTPNDPAFQPGFEHADTTVAAAVPFYGVYDFTGGTGFKHGDKQIVRFLERVIVKEKIATSRAVFEAASPIHRVTAGAPPFLVIHGGRDSLAPVEGARAFAEKLRGVSRAPVAYMELPGTEHAFDVFPSVRTAHMTRIVAHFCEAVRASIRTGR